MEKKKDINILLGTLPDKPGVYQYFDEHGTIIYVGKAKNLKKRVSSYFAKEQTGKTYVLVKKIFDIKHIVVDTEFDALLLENNLIKKYRPRYNILLKDDKTYPWICIKNEPFPRIFSTRNVIKDGSQYFGPYASVRMMNTLLDLIKELCPLRTCSLALSDENIRKKKFKVCLEYHLGNCKGPCEALQTAEDYQNNIEHIQKIIKGNISEIIRELRILMMQYADELQFENAQIIKEKIELLENYQSKSTVFSNTLKDVDVFSIDSDDEAAYANFLKVVDGAVVQAHTIELKSKLDEDLKELLAFAMVDFRERFHSETKEILVNIDPEIEIPGVHVSVPKIGDKKKLIELSERNLKFYMLEKQKKKDLVDPERHSKRILAQMQKDLNLKEPPMHIECFDNSNMQGDYPVSAMTVFKNAKPSKKDYRHFNIRTVEGPNDFASMEEVLYRRYKRVLDEGQPLPNLIVVDGGKGQLSSAVKILTQLNIFDKVALIGIAERLEEIFKPGDPFPLHLDKKSETLKIIQQIRDEAHRFGITHYRKKHEKGLIKTELTEIPGIGDTIALKLLQNFHSVKNIRNLPVEELAGVIGQAKAQLVVDYFNKK